MSYGKITAQQEDGLIHFHAPGQKFSARKSLRLVLLYKIKAKKRQPQ
jgi:hypothetical protein